MLSLTAVALWLAASPVEVEEARFAAALVPRKGALSATEANAAFKALSARKGWAVRVEEASRAGVPGLDPEFLERTAADLPPETRKALAAAPKAMMVLAKWPRTDTTGLKALYEAVLKAGAKSEALVFEPDWFKVVTLETFKQRRLDKGWVGALPFVTAHVALHSVAMENNTLLLDSSGLARFGLREIGLPIGSRYNGDSTASMLNVVAQRLIEGARPDAKGRLAVKLAELKAAPFREAMIESCHDNARQAVVVGFKKPAPGSELDEDGLELTFPELQCNEATVCLDLATSALFGWKDQAHVVEHDAQVLKAKDRALAALKKLQPALQKGLPPGQILLVKARFPYPDGSEWMWVAVQSWAKDRLVGTLENEPELARQVKAGQTVNVGLDDVMDYIHQFPDGTFVGNETGRVLWPRDFEAADGGRYRVKEQ